MNTTQTANLLISPESILGEQRPTLSINEAVRRFYDDSLHEYDPDAIRAALNGATVKEIADAIHLCWPKEPYDENFAGAAVLLAELGMTVQ